MRIGIIGAGQLGQMLGFAARELGHTCCFLDPSANPPAAVVGPVVQAPFDDRVALAVLADKSDVITYEFENVPVDALLDIADLVPIYPPLEALRLAQDRLEEKRLFDRLDIPTPQYRTIDSAADLEDAVAAIGLPLVIKTRRLGYDGKGQFVLEQIDQVQRACSQLGPSGLLAEQWVAFDYEVSIIGVRNANGDLATYCLTRNEHISGILHISRAPVEGPLLTEQAEHHVRRLLEHVEYIGVLTLEFFVAGDTLYANEFAPRVHNSGHWTIEGAETSQFTNHLLAITNEPPGPTRCTGYSGMVNLIGRIPGAARQLQQGWLHDYGKTPRPGRKLGHITVVADSAALRDRWIDETRESMTDSTSRQGTEA
jgi:5-(carboxyamino)imidazole ribonucleotide synthase